MKQRSSSQAHLGLFRVPLRPAVFGLIGDYMEIRPDCLQAKQPTALLRVDVTQRAAMGAPVTGSGFALCGVKTGRPVVLVAVCLGKILAMAAFNPLDPETRQNMKKVAASGKFTCAFQFDLPIGKEPPSRIDNALVALPLDVFSKSLKETEEMTVVTTNDWLDATPNLIASGMLSLGISANLLQKVHFRPFVVIPTSAVHNGQEAC